MKILLGWAINALALLALPYLLSGIHVKSFWTALLFALVLGLLNALVRPLLVLLTLPITILTLGLFLVVVNGLIFWLADAFVPGFEVAGFWWALAGAVVYSIVSWAIGAVIFGLGKGTQG